MAVVKKILTKAERNRLHRLEYFELMEKLRGEAIELLSLPEVLQVFGLSPILAHKKLMLKFLIREKIKLYYIPSRNKLFLDLRDIDNLALDSRKLKV